MFRFLRGSPLTRLRGRELATLGIGLPSAQHLPDNCRQLSHHRDACDATASPTLDAFEPFPQSRILPQDLVSHLRKQPPRDDAPCFGNAAKSLVVFATVAASRRESPIVGKAAGSREAFHITDATCQSHRSTVTHAWPDSRRWEIGTGYIETPSQFPRIVKPLMR